MKNRNKLLTVILPVLACLGFLPGAQAVPISRQRKDAMRLSSSIRGSETRDLVGRRSFRLIIQASIPQLAGERCSPIRPIPILQWARRHCCSTPPAHRMWPLELTQWFSTTARRTTMLSARLLSLIMTRADNDRRWEHGRGSRSRRYHHRRQ